MFLCAQPYPDGWNLPGGGAQRGNVLNLNGAGDPLTPGYPAKGAFVHVLEPLCIYMCVALPHIVLSLTEYTYRFSPEDGVGLPRIPVHPIGFHDAVHLLKYKLFFLCLC